MKTTTVPVLVAGAGPAGLTAAIAAARQGVEVLLVDRHQDHSNMPRATMISTRSMELLRTWGLERQILAGAVEVEWALWLCETLAQASQGSVLRLGVPTPEQTAVLSPTAPSCVPQDHLEPVLLEHLRSLHPARVALGTEVVDVDSGDEGVRAVLRDIQTGASRLVHARYLVAADGAHSMVRAALGIAMRGPESVMEGVLALFHAPLWDRLGDPHYGLYSISRPDAAGSFLPAGPGDRWIYGVNWQPGHAKPADPSAGALTRRIRLASGVEDLDLRIERISTYAAAAQLADRFRHASAFLVGDAAHRASPRGGTGMNTALQDGYDLGWKLAWVLRGWAGAPMLESYEAERRPVAEHNVTRSADPSGSLRDVEQELWADLGGRIPHLWLPGPRGETGRVSTLDLLGPGLTLFTGPASATWQAAAASLSAPMPLAVRSLDTITARALGVRGDGALLVRPDGFPAGWWPNDADAESGLRGTVRSAVGGAAGSSPATARHVA